ncbi:uncharacterized protein LOC111618559 [Centruroides sculpturatus]|uniref:uncharacterized protein LOC111618559 n=1 Tax=Centruroides sculpturatus TaxID=218467 RepID=UPI000C6EA730|nr:uncharacterized protein LOC111618559 [Centruroides sculpturatus]
MFHLLYKIFNSFGIFPSYKTVVPFLLGLFLAYIYCCIFKILRNASGTGRCYNSLNTGTKANSITKILEMVTKEEDEINKFENGFEQFIDKLLSQIENDKSVVDKQNRTSCQPRITFKKKFITFISPLVQHFLSSQE